MSYGYDHVPMTVCEDCAALVWEGEFPPEYEGKEGVLELYVSALESPEPLVLVPECGGCKRVFAASEKRCVVIVADVPDAVNDLGGSK